MSQTKCQASTAQSRTRSGLGEGLSADNLPSAIRRREFNSFQRADLLHPEMLDEGRGSHCWCAKNRAREWRLPQWSTAICLGAALPNPSPSHGRGLAYLHLTEAELTERSNKAIAKPDDLAPATNDDQNIRPIRPPHADVAAGFSPSAASFEASAFDLRSTGRGPIGRLGRTNRSTSRGLTRC